MFIVPPVQKPVQAPKERNIRLSATGTVNMSLLKELKSILSIFFYKHSAPTGAYPGLHHRT
jgi:hypothetical protein